MFHQNLIEMRSWILFLSIYLSFVFCAETTLKQFDTNALSLWQSKYKEYLFNLVDLSLPEQVHLSVVDPTSSVNVIWVTWNRSDLSYAKYGVKSGVYPFQKKGSAHTYNKGYCILPDECGWHGYIHVVTMDSLQPGTTYYYRVGNGHR